MTLLLLLACAAGTVWAVVRITGSPSDGLLVAAAPTLVLAGTINWDLLAVLATTLALLAWARDRPALAGVCLGLGTAAKLYPVFLFWPLLILAVRERRWRPLATAAGAGVGAWVAVNLPVALAYPDGWLVFWRFNRDRPADFGSVWYALELLGTPVPAVTPVAAGSFAVLCLAIGALGLAAPRPPSPAQLAFLVVAAFCVTNKVYSPQYVLWMLPLVVLARASAPRGRVIRDWALWQAAEVAYWYMVWRYLAGTLATAWSYPAATFVRVAVTLYLAGQVVRDVLQVGGRYAGATAGTQVRASRETWGVRSSAAYPSESATTRQGGPDER
jgi:uncharacterized membrane protein